nr:MAG TPA: hypothetical protein [Caudoviricetes sp.]
MYIECMFTIVFYDNLFTPKDLTAEYRKSA